MLHDLLPKVALEVIPVDQFYKLEGNPFSIDGIKPSRRTKIVEQALEGVLAALRHEQAGSR